MIDEFFEWLMAQAPQLAFLENSYLAALFIIILTAIGSFLINWIFKSHFRSFPLVFPFLSIGMYFDGHIVFSVLTLAFSGISVLGDRISLIPNSKDKIVDLK